MFKKVLALSPHTDDETIAAGGTLAKFSRLGAEITVLAFSWSFNSPLKEEFFRSTKILGVSDPILLEPDFPRHDFPENRQKILDLLIDFNQKNHFDLVLTPSSFDRHQDHQVMRNEAERAFTKTSTIWGYYIWKNCKIFRFDKYVNLTEEDVDKKMRALGCYDSQKELRPKQFDLDLQRCILRSWGSHKEFPYAEPFEIINSV